MRPGRSGEDCRGIGKTLNERQDHECNTSGIAACEHCNRRPADGRHRPRPGKCSPGSRDLGRHGDGCNQPPMQADQDRNSICPLRRPHRRRGHCPVLGPRELSNPTPARRWSSPATPGGRRIIGLVVPASFLSMAKRLVHRHVSGPQERVPDQLRHELRWKLFATTSYVLARLG